MESKARQRLELFVENAQAVKRGFPWQNVLKRLAALLCAAEDKAVDLSAIRECHALIQKRAGLFSSLWV